MGGTSKLLARELRVRDREANPAARLQRAAAYMIQDPTETLRTIQAPTLLVWGEKDWLVAFATTPAKFQAALPNSTLVSFPGLGHMPQEEDPTGTVVKVREFLMQ